MEEIERKLTAATQLLHHFDQLLQSVSSSITGGAKLSNKIKAEVAFLHKIKSGKIAVAPCHLVSSNIKNLRALVEVIDDIHYVQGVDGVLQPMHYVEQQYKHCIHVDVITNRGSCWVKVIARNPTSLLLVAQGQEQYGEKTLLDIAGEYLLAASANHVAFQPPVIVFHFATGVPLQLSTQLTQMGIHVHGKVIDDSTSSSSHHNNLSEMLSQLNSSRSASCHNDKVNLDITALITLVSNLSNGSCHYTYDIPALSQQANQERLEPALPSLQSFLANKTLVVCRTCLDAFQEIITTIGGEQETNRAHKLLQTLQIVDDSPSQRTLSLKNSSKVNQRTKIIFGTGDYLKLVTVTANKGFVRAALQSGVHLSVFQHEPRALTEIKEKAENLLPEGNKS